MSPRGQAQNEQLRAEALAKISTAALKVFAEYGYHGATMKRIARAAGLSYGLAYHYFPSKAGIFRRLVDFALESTIAAMHEILDGPGTAWERIETFSGMLVREAISGESSLYFLLMLQAMTQGKGIPGLLNRIKKGTAVHYKILVPLIAQAQKSGEAAQGDPLVLAAAYFSLLQGLALLAFDGRRLEKKITPGILMSVLRNGAQRI
jgi:AcrR family transcriptional regulator